MSNTVNLKKYESPYSPGSVGWTRPYRVCLADENNPLLLECGEKLAPIEVEYEIYGTMNSKKDNVILVLHALSGDAHAAGWDREAEAMGRLWRKNKPGWWDGLIGPGKALDTNKYCVICSNVLGSCYGTTGPASINPKTGKPYGLSFPVVTIKDWVVLQERLISYLGIDKLYAVIGGSLGGQQALEWTLAFPDRVEHAIILAAAPKLSAEGLAFNAVARHAIMSDPNFRNGNYYGKTFPKKGLATARMIGHITYLSKESMEEKFGRQYRNSESPRFHFGIDFEVESYLQYQGQSFVERFDANSYLYITRAMDYYDAASWGDGDLDKACSRAKAKFLLISFSSDWLYTPGQMEELALALQRNKKSVSYINIPSKLGHDAFLLEIEAMEPIISDFLEGG